jgi:GT2 family glycosyltransferase/glycosyltransferase involved in cell wall biosynthesis
LKTGFLGLDRDFEVARIADRVFEVALPGEHDFNVYSGTLEGETLEQAFAALEDLADGAGIRDGVILVQYPSWEPLAWRLRERFGWPVVYDCLDEHTGFGTHGPSTADEEARLLAESDLVVATSRTLFDRVRKERADVLRLPNAADVEHFSALPARETSPLAALARPVIGYYGAIASWFDTEAVRLAAERHPGWSFALVGNTHGAELGDLPSMPNVTLLGEVPYAALPSYLTAFDVCTIPFRRTPLTEATNPVKIYEYFATGKPVVARRLPELETYADVVSLYDTPEAFVANLERAVKESVAPGPAADQRRRVARENTWKHRYEALRERLGALPRSANVSSSAPTAPIGNTVPPRGMAGEGADSADAVAKRVKEIRRLSEIVRSQAEGIDFLRDEVAGRERQLAAREKELLERIRELERGLAQSEEISEARDGHLRAAMAEISRWQNSRLGRLQQTLFRARQVPGRARRALGKATAPGTAVYSAGTKLLPRPLAKFLRRSLAPVPKPDALVRLEPSARGTDAVPAEPAGRYDVVVFSIIDWDFRFQRPQQLATQFGRHGHRVFYLSTTQFLAPGGPAWDLTRKADKVAELRIRSRRPLNIYKGKADEADVAALLESFEELAADFAMGDTVCLVQIPYWAPFAERLRERLGWRVVYDCMDEWTNFPGFGPDVLSLEDGLVRRADLTIVSADKLLEKWKDAAPRHVLAKNGIDADHYHAHYGENTLLGSPSHPVIGYYGALASWVDVPLLEKVADAYPEGTIVLAGGHFDVDLSPLKARKNVRLLGQRPYAEMPMLLWSFDACIIPFLVNDITEATNPVKFYEYLFGGKPVVAPALTELLPFDELSYLARGHEEFLRQLSRALAESPTDSRRAARRKVAEANDWAHRYETIDGGIAAAHPLVSIVVVTYGGAELTRDCLESLARETWPRLEIIVVDNASGDSTPELLREAAAEDRRIRTIFNAENRGFAAANNQGIAASRGEIVILLNNDTVVPPGLVGRLVRHLQRDPSIGLLCPTTNFCGNEARVEPDYTDIAGLPAYAARRAREHRGRVFDIGVAAMYCVAARRALLDDVGPLDEAYGVGMSEDDDFAVRMRAKGYRVECAEDVYVHHVGQGAFRKLSPEQYDALWKKNQAYYEKKFGVAWKKHIPRKGVSAVASKVGVE